MPIDYKKYPENWKQIIKAEKEKTGNKCKLCGAPNGEKVLRPVDIKKSKYPWYHLKGVLFEVARMTKIVLTVHHIDGDIKNNHPANLLVCCQRCHLILDMYKHIQNRAKRRNK